VIHPKSFHSAPHSLVQSAVAAYLQRSAPGTRLLSQGSLLQETTAALAQLPHPRNPQFAVEPRSKQLVGASLLSPKCIALLLEYADAWIISDTDKRNAVRTEFHDSGCDPELLSAVADYIDAYWIHHDNIPYVFPASAESQDFVYPLPEKPSLRIGILGDWGSGDTVASYVLQQLMAQSPDLIIHVGDVYYAGTDDEVQKNFLSLLDQYANVPVYNLPGNHDMYSGGKPFYSALAKLNSNRSYPGTSTAASIQQASFFCLKNSWLQLQGMDTGYFDSDLFHIASDTTRLHELEAEWHLDKLKDASNNRRAAFLFSHHQAWSPFLRIDDGPILTRATELPGQMLWLNERLQSALKEVPLETVRAWFWGHEHVLEVFDREAIRNSTLSGNPGQSLSALFPWLPYGACVGYSGFTMLESDDPYQTQYGDDFKLLYNTNYRLAATMPRDGTDAIYDRGFAILSVGQEGGATATYYALPGDGSINKSTPFPPSTIS
jgi:3',5'-cyclic AMP phosphodiesterase CpdA